MYDQAGAASSLEKNMLEEPTELAKANSILETEMATDKVRPQSLVKIDTYVTPLVQMPEMELNTAKCVCISEKIRDINEIRFKIGELKKSMTHSLLKMTNLEWII